MAESPKTVSEYIRTFPPATQQLLQAIRTTIQDAVPEAQEAISYRIAAFTVGGKYLMYFAGHSKHVAVYPIPPLPASTQKQIEPYQASKGTLRFALDKPLPLALIRKLALAHRKRIKETAKK